MMFKVPKMGSIKGTTPKYYGASQGPFDCEVDTGNKALIIPVPIYQAFMAEFFPSITAKAYPRVDCDMVSSSKAVLYLSFGSFGIQIPVQQLLFDFGDEYCRLLLASQAIDSTTSVCSLGIPLLFNTFGACLPPHILICVEKACSF
jgi:hypothetical protein